MKRICAILLSAFFLLSGCSENTQAQADSIPPHTSFTIDSKFVGEMRTINVWTPDGYEQGLDSLPVMYMADGGIVEEDFPHIANTFSKLIQENKIKPFILVGIQNTQRRRDLTGPTQVKADKEIAPVVGGSQNFRAFIKEELIPEINKNYRTNSIKGILGESLSGLFVVETMLLDPQMFDYYIAFDPSMWWNDQGLVKKAKEYLDKFPSEHPIVFWFAGSGVKGMAPIMKKFVKALETENLPFLKWKYSDEPQEEHSTIFRATKEKALIWALNQPLE